MRRYQHASVSMQEAGEEQGRRVRFSNTLLSLHLKAPHLKHLPRTPRGVSSQTTPTSVAAIACGGAYQQVSVGPRAVKDRFLSAATYLWRNSTCCSSTVLVYYSLYW